MKKIILCAGIALSLSTMTSCGDNNAKETHTHDDGSVHDDHTADTVQPNQQEFKVSDSAAAIKDSAANKPHTHKDDKPHTH